MFLFVVVVCVTLPHTHTFLDGKNLRLNCITATWSCSPTNCEWNWRACVCVRVCACVYVRMSAWDTLERSLDVIKRRGMKLAKKRGNKMFDKLDKRNKG